MESLKIFLATFVALMMLIGIGLGVYWFLEKQDNTVVLDEGYIQQEIKDPGTINPIVSTGMTFIEVEEEVLLKEQLPTFQNELLAAKDINEDVMCWLNVPGTNISYPIPVNTTRYDANGDIDWDYYLNRRLDGSYAPDLDEQSVVYGDSRNDLTSIENMDGNTILYGHNWTNIETGGIGLKIASDADKMFAQLPSFSNLEFAQENMFFTLDFEGEQAVFVIFAAMYLDTWNPDNLDGYYYIETNPNIDQLTVILSEARKRSEHTYKVPVIDTDKIVTLSTCTRKYGQDSNQRFVIMGRMLREGEDLDDFEQPFQNPTPKRPDVAY